MPENASEHAPQAASGEQPAAAERATGQGPSGVPASGPDSSPTPVTSEAPLAIGPGRVQPADNSAPGGAAGGVPPSTGSPASPPSPVVVPPPPGRIGRTERVIRPAQGRLVGGVSAGVGEHLGVDVWWVRAFFAVLSLFGGTGLVVYALLWIFTPVAGETGVGFVGGQPVLPPGAAPRGAGGVVTQPTRAGPVTPLATPGVGAGHHAPGAGTGERSEPGTGDGSAGRDDESSGQGPHSGGSSYRSGGPRLILLGVLILAGAALWAALTFGAGYVLPPLLVLGAAAVLLGLYLAWTYLDDQELRRQKAGPEAPFSSRESDGEAAQRRETGATPPFRVWLRRVRSWLVPLVGVVLVAGGALALAAGTQGTAFTAEVLLASAAVLTGVAIVALPWGVRAWRRFVAQEQERIREAERADMAAHLHDSVLQTLALIQRTDDPARAKLLARVQERELREWLYGGGPSAAPESFAAALTAVVHEVEETYGVPVDVVTSGDRPPSEATDALLRALREALLNAVRHGAPPVSVYAEAGPRRVEAFVRDHGPGFDLDSIPDGRLGVRESIIGRMQRAGGSARIRRLDNGTEVELAVDLPGETTSPEHDSNDKEPDS